MQKTVVRTEQLTLPSAFLGTRHELKIHTYGDLDARPHVYIQAGLHAGEHPGILVCCYLRKILEDLAASGKIKGRIDLVPIANPVGLAQILNGEINGRYDFLGRTNFNRHFPNVEDELSRSIKPRLRGESNRPVLERAIVEALEQHSVASHVDALKLELLKRAAVANLAFDLHCDGESLLHIFAAPEGAEVAVAVAQKLGAGFVLINEKNNDGAFDDTINSLWRHAASLAHDAGHLIDPCCALTIELRGRADVSVEFAEHDALAIIEALADLEIIEHHHEPDRKEGLVLCPQVFSTQEMEVISAQGPGVIAYTADLGAMLEPGAIVATIHDPTAEDNRTIELRTLGGGVLFSRHISKLAFPGMEVCKIAPRRIA